MRSRTEFTQCCCSFCPHHSANTSMFSFVSQRHSLRHTVGLLRSAVRRDGRMIAGRMIEAWMARGARPARSRTDFAQRSSSCPHHSANTSMFCFASQRHSLRTAARLLRSAVRRDGRMLAGRMIEAWMARGPWQVYSRTDFAQRCCSFCPPIVLPKLFRCATRRMAMRGVAAIGAGQGGLRSRGCGRAIWMRATASSRGL